MRVPTRCLSLVLALGAAAPLAAKAPVPAAKPSRPSAEVAATDADVILRLRAGILRAEDERDAADPALVAALSHPVASLRQRAVRALGRIGDASSVSLVSRSLVDRDLEVRREAVFALGEIESPAALTSLMRVLTTDDAEQRALAAEALAKIAWTGPQRAQAGGHVVTTVLNTRAESDASVVARAMRASWRFGIETPGLVTALANGFLRPEPAISEAAAYAAARLGDARLGNLYELAMRDDRPVVRALGCRGLGRIARAKDGEKQRSLDRRAVLIRRALDVDPAVRVAALSALEAFPPAEPVITKELFDVNLRGADTNLRRAALGLVGAWRVSHELPTVLALVQQGSRDAFPEAAAALVKLQGNAAVPLLLPAADADWTRRAIVAEALGVEELASSQEAASLLDALLKDRDARVVAAALDAAISVGRPDAPLLALAHLGARDVVVRSIAAGSLPKLVGEGLSRDEAAAALRRCWRESATDASDDARITSLDALAELLGTDAKPDLVAAASEPAWTIRLKAHALLLRLGLEAPPLGTAGLARPLSFYQEMARAEMAAAPRTMRFETDRGVIDVVLATGDAPMTVFQLTELAGQGWFNGLTFHRVVPDFVAQGGCPRGDGWGGPGMSLRCEINRRPFDRGAAGMALSGKDTGGSQFFFTLSPQPHLDGGYTVFGHVTPESMPVVDAIRRFDRITRVTVLEGTPAPAAAATGL